MVLLVVGCAEAVSAAPALSPLPGDATESHPEIQLRDPDGYCAVDRVKVETGQVETGFEPGLPSGMRLLALYAPCWEAGMAGGDIPVRIDDWIAVEMNAVTYPSDDERKLGPAGSAGLLCDDARSAAYGHPQLAAGTSFAEAVAAALARLSDEKPVVFLGVVDEDREAEACFLAAVRRVPSNDGVARTFLTVTAFSAVGDRWIAQSVRRGGEGQSADDALATAKRAARALREVN